MTMIEKQTAPLVTNLRYPPHKDRTAIDLSDSTISQDHERAYQAYLQSEPFYYFADRVAREIDPYLTPDQAPDLYLGRSTSEILSNFRLIDPFTHGHSASVAELGLLFQQELPKNLGLQSIPSHELAVALLLHDIKKLEMNDLLHYPDLLTMAREGTFITSTEFPQLSWFPNEGTQFEMLNPHSAVFGPAEKAEIHKHPLEGALHLLRLNMPPVVIAGALSHHSRFVYPLDDAPYPQLNELAEYPELLRVLDEVPPAFFDLANVADHVATAEACRPYKPIISTDIVVERLQKMGNERRIHPAYARVYRNLVDGYHRSWMRHSINVPCVKDDMAIRVPQIYRPEQPAHLQLMAA